MCRSVFDALDRQWAVLVRSHEAQDALRRWGPELELDVADLDELVSAILAGPTTVSDRALVVLARWAPTDHVAARTVLQALHPGLRNLGRRLAGRGSFDPVDQEIVALAWERIRTYSVNRRPRAVALNVILDVRKRFIAEAMKDAAGVQMLHDDSQAFDNTVPLTRSAEDDALDHEIASLRRAHARISSAVDRGAISPLSARVVWRTRVQQYDDADVAAELGVAVRTLQRRRQRAERELALAG